MHEVPTQALADLLGMWTEYDIGSFFLYIRYRLPFGVRVVTYGIQNGPWLPAVSSVSNLTSNM